jgi:hypothetical protein
VNQKTVRKVTATFRASGPSVGHVTIQEIAEFQYITMLDGNTQIAEGIKAYSINPREPVNRDDSGFTLARTGEHLVVI